LFAQYCREPLRLRAFAATIKPFEGDEFSAMEMGRHREMIALGKTALGVRSQVLGDRSQE
jgi:hypothetical protein